MKNSNRIAMAAAITVFVASNAASAEEREDAHHEIDQIVVTATPLSRQVEDLAQPTSILYGDELAKKQSTSIGETLSQEPGLSSSYFGPISSRPVIRGQFGERVRVYVLHLGRDLVYLVAAGVQYGHVEATLDQAVHDERSRRSGAADDEGLHVLPPRANEPSGVQPTTRSSPRVPTRGQ